MLKKAILGAAFVGLIAFLVAGAINRTQDKTEGSVQAAGLGGGQQRANNNVEDRQTGADHQLSGSQGSRGAGRSTVQNERQYPNYQETIDEWLTYNGTVAQVPTEGVELIVETSEGQLVIGTGPQALVEQGADVQIGDELEVTGYWENDEFKASEITLLASGQTIVLRDELGRPSWSGSQQAGRGAQADLLQTGRQGNASGAAAASSEGWGGNGRNGSASEFTQGTGQAVVNEWILLQGAAVSIDENALIVKLPSGELITIENRPWWFIQDQGFSAEVGDEIELSGFYEGEDFETGQLTNLTTNLTVDVREDSGRPLWAGGGQSS